MGEIDGNNVAITDGDRVAYVENRGHWRAVASLGNNRFIIAYSIPNEGGKVITGELHRRMIDVRG